ncbi:uncharacterized protein LOC105197207 [Solenopsis invicta]|uniref:uncharacterized protein LOC105197207 n=1 Tax=Solenopsis invicta TaxID=13686 RepID=UPI0005963405|nr:uncharacterized protein LOC105197207 [Solenopsis invicta]
MQKQKTRLTAMMNQEHGGNYEDRIEFIIALMTKDYEKARDVGDRLLKQNRNNVDVARALNILQHKKHEECERSSVIESDSIRKGSDATDGDDIDFTDNNAVIAIDPAMANKIVSHDMSRLNNEARSHLDFKRNMHRVILIKTNKKNIQAKDLTKC